VPGVRVEAVCLPMSAVGGDFYDVIGTPDGRVIAIVADVSGHGVPAALVASMVKVAFAAEAERFDRPGDILGGSSAPTSPPAASSSRLRGSRLHTPPPVIPRRWCAAPTELSSGWPAAASF
jgi:hypothetical protein